VTLDRALTAGECGRVSAVAGRGQRQMRTWAAEYPRLYSAKAFDPALYSTLALAAAFSGPWLRDDQLRMANRACLWCFGLDWLIDYAATSRLQVEALVRGCLAIADDDTSAGDAGRAGTTTDDAGVDLDAEAELAHFLTAIRDELSAAPAYPALRAVWRDELERMLTAMAREWDWKAARAEGRTGHPTFEEYLANADNLGFSFVFATHWISLQGTESTGSSGSNGAASTGSSGSDGAGGRSAAGSPTSTEIADIRRASRQAQRVIRLLNDLGTYERDLAWGDLNALALGVTRADVEQRIGRLTAELRDLLDPVESRHPGLAAYMARQVDFCVGFYGITDYWGEP
jgi:Terpene synthase family 2, C-terminal metal binding